MTSHLSQLVALMVEHVDSLEVVGAVWRPPRQDLKTDRHRLYSWAYHKAEVEARRAGLSGAMFRRACRKKAQLVVADHLEV